MAGTAGRAVSARLAVMDVAVLSATFAAAGTAAMAPRGPDGQDE